MLYARNIKASTLDTRLQAALAFTQKMTVCFDGRGHFRYPNAKAALITVATHVALHKKLKPSASPPKTQLMGL